jgi:tRNA (Thr-GGU) A37 N-methylase
MEKGSKLLQMDTSAGILALSGLTNRPSPMQRGDQTMARHFGNTQQIENLLTRIQAGDVKRAILQVHPRGNLQNPLTGVFACRSPVRPNLIALSLCKIVSVRGNVVEIDKIDAAENSPILDLKPFAPGQDSASDVSVPKWAGPK